MEIISLPQLTLAIAVLAVGGSKCNVHYGAKRCYIQVKKSIYLSRCAGFIIKPRCRSVHDPAPTVDVRVVSFTTRTGLRINLIFF